MRKYTLLILFALSGGLMMQAQEEYSVKLQQVLDNFEFDSIRVDSVDIQHVMPTNFRSNWHFGILLGGWGNWGSNMYEINAGKRVNPAVAFTIGKQLTPINDIDFQFTFGGNSTGANSAIPGVPTDALYRWMTFGFYGEWKPDFVNMIGGYRQGRFFNLQAIVGLGGETAFAYSKPDWNAGNVAFDPKPHFVVALRLGLQATFRLPKGWRGVVEVSNSFVDDHYDGYYLDGVEHATTKRSFNEIFDGHVNFLVGVQYRLSKKDGSGTDYRFNHVRNNITELRQHADSLGKLEDELAAGPDTIAVGVNRQSIHVLVAFDPHKVEVDRLQQSNLYMAYRQWFDHAQSGRLFVVNASGEDNDIFQKRVESIRMLLNQRYDVPVDKVAGVASEADIVKNGLAGQNSYVVIVINE